MGFEPVSTLDRALALSKRCLGRGLLRNCYLTPEDYRRAVEAGTLRALEREEGVFLLLRRPYGFERLCFAVRPGAAAPEWDKELPLVAELPRRGAEPDPAEDILARWGFKKALERVRLRRVETDAPPEGSDAAVQIAGPSDSAAVCAFLARHFDRLTGCLPTPDELAGERCYCIPGASDMRGVLRVSLEKRFGEIRHLALDTELRGTGAAGALLSAYHAGLGARESRVWTGADNARALRFYEKNAYHPDGFRSSVWIKEN